MPGTVETSSRRASPVLLVLAALCFLLPFIGVSCASSSQSGLGPFPGGAPGAAQVSSCLSALVNTDLYSYSGLNLVAGTAPSAGTVPSSCSAVAGGSTSSGRVPTVGPQPLLIAVLVLIIIGVAAAALRMPLRAIAGAGSAFLAAVLVIAGNVVAHDAVRDRISALVDQSNGSADLGVRSLGGFGGLFDIHAEFGFTLVLVALFAAVAANLVALVARSGMRLTTARTTSPPAPPPPVPPAPPPPPPR